MLELSHDRGRLIAEASAPFQVIVVGWRRSTGKCDVDLVGQIPQLLGISRSILQRKCMTACLQWT